MVRNICCGLFPSKFTVREIRISTNQGQTKLQSDTFSDFDTSVLGERDCHLNPNQIRQTEVLI